MGTKKDELKSTGGAGVYTCNHGCPGDTLRVSLPLAELEIKSDDEKNTHTKSHAEPCARKQMKASTWGAEGKAPGTTACPGSCWG